MKPLNPAFKTTPSQPPDPPTEELQLSPPLTAVQHGPVLLVQL